MSVNPVLAAVADAVLLAEVPALHEAVGIAVIVSVNAVAVAGHRRGGPTAAAYSNAAL